jgi:kinetochore protein NDC80
MSQRPKSNSRRMTLGSGVNSANQGSTRRKSIDPGSTGTGGTIAGTPSTAKSRPPRGRVSMIPRVGRENLVPPSPAPYTPQQQSSSSKPRRTSISGVGVGAGDNRRQSLSHPPPSAAAHVYIDPRPTSDKVFQQECIRNLLHYLVSSGYEYPISHKSLARPSGKDFSNIVTFMLRRVDPNFQDGTMKMEDEVSMNFKALGYPIPVSKTALVAAGSPHTWPSLLAALTWLMEQLQLMDQEPQEDLNKSGKFDSLEELEQKTDRAFFTYLSGAYSAFLRGDEQMTEQLENALADRFEKDDGVIEQEIERVTDTNGEIVERIHQLTRESQE